MKKEPVSIEELLPKAGGSIYRLVRMASNRALELSEGKICLVDNDSSDKLTSKALAEISQGKVESKDSAKYRLENGIKEPKHEQKIKNEELEESEV